MLESYSRVSSTIFTLHGSIFDYFVVSMSVGVSRCKITLRHSKKHESLPLDYEGGQWLEPLI